MHGVAVDTVLTYFDRAPLRRRLPAARRVRRPREFALIIAAPAASSWTARGSWLALKAVWHPHDPTCGDARTRLGLTIGRRWAARSVDRSRLKRIARESFRHAAPTLDVAAEAAGMTVDVSVRLIASVPATLSAAALVQAVRAEADHLLGLLLARLRRTASNA